MFHVKQRAWSGSGPFLEPRELRECLNGRIGLMLLL